MVAEQAAEVSALEGTLVIDLLIAAVLAGLGVVACVYGFRQRRRRSSRMATSIDGPMADGS
jgi:hypothetical protein